MKIGILTLPFNCNYGGLLQCYALQSFLKGLGHEVVVIKRVFPKRISFKNKAINAIKLLLGRTDKYKKSVAAMRCFENAYIIETLQIKEIRQYDSLLKDKIDALVVGSDQVWRFDYTKEHYAEYFFDFAEKWTVKRLAFAASFGVKDWNLGKKETSKIKKLASLFDRISTREESGIKLCQEKLACKATHLLDPAFLLSRDEYRSLYKTKVNKTDAIATYILDFDEEKLKSIKQISHAIDKDIIYIGKNPHTKVYQAIEDWIKSIDESNLVVTDSFHGVVFSIIFNKPFVLMINENRGAERFISLSNTFGPFQYFVPGSSFSSKFVNYLDRDKCKQIIDENKLLSTNFIRV